MKKEIEKPWCVFEGTQALFPKKCFGKIVSEADRCVHIIQDNKPSTPRECKPKEEVERFSRPEEMISEICRTSDANEALLEEWLEFCFSDDV